MIQGSACVYSRKVEYLYALVHQTLDAFGDAKCVCFALRALFAF